MKGFKILLLLALLIGLSYEGLMWLDRPEHYTEQELGFTFKGRMISGSLMLPTSGPPPYPVAVFVHDDGPQERDMDGYYRPMWEALAESGVASFSWDKPGAGESEGDWLDMDFEQRGLLLETAFSYIRSRPEIRGRKAGAIGFGQGCWIIPVAAANGLRPDFAVLVSGAVTVRDQYLHYAANSLRAQGVDELQVGQVQDFLRQELDVIDRGMTFEDYLYWYKSNAPRPWAKLRGLPTRQEWERTRAIHDYDVRRDLPALRCPVLALMGGQSLRADPAQVEAAYQRAFVDRLPDWRVKVFDGVDHTLRPPKAGRETSRTPFARWWDMRMLRESDFAPGMIDLMTAWVAARAEAD